MLQATDPLPMNFGFLGKGNSSRPEGLTEQIEAGAIGLKLHEDWGIDAGGDRRLPRRRRRARRAGGDPHRHAERVRLRRRLDRGVQGTDDSHLSHRRRRRRARAGHHQGVRRAERAAELDQPDAALHRQHARRAPRHAHGLPPSRQEHPGGRGVRREPHPRRDDRRRGRAARSRRDQHDVERQPGDGPRRRGHHAHLADGAQDARRARPAARGARRQRQPAHPPLHREVHHQPGDHPRHRATTSARSRSASWPTWCCGSRRSSARSRSWCSRAASSPGRRWATRTRRSRRRSRW